tara:strand:- start:461 stop:754 length:294 start_codon:yes stop_codon:yes gene_type:complete
MVDTPDAVLLYVPLMKGLGMGWKEIKETPRHELEGLLAAYSAHEQFHSMDGYDDNDVSTMAKDKPQVRQSYHRYLETRSKYERMIGKRKEVKSFRDL